jgi:hypothetical protein
MAPSNIFGTLKAQVAQIFGIDVDRATFAEDLRMDLAVLLRGELHNMARAQSRGEPTDVGKLASLIERLVSMALRTGS